MFGDLLTVFLGVNFSELLNRVGKVVDSALNDLGLRHIYLGNEKAVERRFCAAALDKGGESAYNTPVKSCAEEEYSRF